MAVRRVAAFFALVLLLTAPLWGLGALVNYEFLPGLPVAALAVLCPALAAAVLSFREGGWNALTLLLQRAVEVRNANRWLIPAIVINPILFGLAFVASRALGANTLDPSVSLVSALILFALFLPTAMLEELGWSGYALDHLQARMSPTLTAVLLGVFGALWHVPTLIQAGRSLEWIARCRRQRA